MVEVLLQDGISTCMWTCSVWAVSYQYNSSKINTNHSVQITTQETGHKNSVLSCNSVLEIEISLTVLLFGSELSSRTESFLIFDRKSSISGCMLDSCFFTASTFSLFNGKMMVVVGRIFEHPYMALISERLGVDSTHSGTMYPMLHSAHGFSLNLIW